MRKFRTPAREEEEGEIDISPLIDCVFILLIFFIVTTVFVEEPGIDLQKPRAVSAAQLKKESIIIAVTPDGRVVYGGKDIGIGGVQPLVARMTAKDANTPVIIQVDENTPSQLFIRAISESKLGNAKQVNVSTQK